MADFFAFETLRLREDFPQGDPYQKPFIAAGTNVTFVRERTYPFWGRFNLVSCETPIFKGWLLVPDDLLERPTA